MTIATTRPEAFELSARYQAALSDLIWVEQSDVTPVTYHSEEEGWTSTRYHIRLVGYIQPDLRARTALATRQAFFQRYEAIIDRLTALQAPWDAMPELCLTGGGTAKYTVASGYTPHFFQMMAKIEMQFVTYR